MNKTTKAFDMFDRYQPGKESWVQTDPEKGFFVVFRFYGPLEGYIEKTWVLSDFELLDHPVN